VNEDGRRNLESFLNLAAPNLRRACGAEVASLYLRHGDAFVSLATRISLIPSAGASAPVEPCVLALAEIKAIRGTVGPERVVPLIEDVIQGALLPPHLPDGCADTIELVRPSIHSPVFLGCERTSAHGVAFPAHVSWVHGDDIRSLIPRDAWDDIERRVPASARPFPNLSAFIRSLGIADGIRHDHSCLLTLLSPYWLRLQQARTKLTDNELRVEVLSRWGNLADHASVSVSPHGHGAFSPFLTSLDGPEWATEPTDEGLLYSTTFGSSTIAGSCIISLNYEGKQVDATVVGLPSSRLLAHEALDPGLELLEMWLFGQKRKSDLFEQGIIWLLHLCGFSTAGYHYRDLQRSPDALAFLGDELALCIECTVEAPSVEKIANLASRAEGLRAASQASGGAVVRVTPLMCIAQERSSVPEAVLHRIEQAGVLALCFEELKEIAIKARRGEAPSSILATFKERLAWAEFSR